MKGLEERRLMVDPKCNLLSISKQCSLFSLNRSSLYYKPTGESALNLELMRLMDEHYLEHPDKGATRMHKWLSLDKGYQVSLNRIERLYYRTMGLRSVLPGPHTSKRNKEHEIFPYLLRGLQIDRVSQVWTTDITYIPMERGFMYLTAVMDVRSRYVLHWSISNSMDAEWCAEVIEEAIRKYGKPEIINTDQGSQYTSDIFKNTVLSKGIKLSMDGKGRATDNAFIERLWRSVKYEKLYLNPTPRPLELISQLKDYFHYYNNERRHSSLHDMRPAEIHTKSTAMTGETIAA